MKSRKRVVLPSRLDATRKGITLRRDMFWMDGCLLKLLDIFVECKEKEQDLDPFEKKLKRELIFDAIIILYHSVVK